MVGEVGFLLGLPRAVAVTAETDCRLLRLSRAALVRLEAEQPDAALALQRVVMRLLSLRLLDKDQLVAALMRRARRAGALPVCQPWSNRMVRWASSSSVRWLMVPRAARARRSMRALRVSISAVKPRRPRATA